MNHRLFASQLILPLFVAGLAPGDDHRVTPSVDTIVQRMAKARDDNQAILRAYTVVRDYRLVGQDRQDSKAQILAQISFVPPSAKKFVIQKSSGTGFGERAVRQMLEHETDIVKNHDSTEMSLANYEFRFLRAELCGGRPCFVLSITPRREDKTLLRGHIWVDATTYLLHRTEGEPAKGPSWWLRESSIIFTYGSVDGMWLQTGSESKANVRFVGRYTMISRDVEYTLIKSGESTPSPWRAQ